MLSLPKRDSWIRAATVAAALVVVALLCFVPESTNDFWLHAAIGRIIWNSGEIPRTALFPFTEAANAHFHAHEWLSSVALFGLEDHLGHERLVFAKGFLGISLFGLLWRLAYRASSDFAASLAIAVAAMAVANFRYYLRPELFALILCAIVLNLVVEYRERREWWLLAACVPVAALWANIHGSAPAALAILGAFAVTERPRTGWPYAACALAMAIAMLANPYGTEVFRFAWQMQGAHYLRQHIYEWMPTFSGAFVGSRGFWAFLAYLALCAMALASGWRRVPLAGWVLLLGFGYLAIDTQRHIVFFAMVSVYPLACAAPRLQALRHGIPSILVVFAASATLLVGYGNLYGAFPYYVVSNNFSLLLVEYLEKAQLEGNVLNSYALGGELIYRSYPRLRPAIDSRIDIYGERYFLYLEELRSDESAFRQFVQRYGVRYALLLRPDFDDGIRKMPTIRQDGWHIAFADHRIVLLSRP